MRTDWQGAYLDGRTAARHRVAIRLTQGGLQLRTPDGVTHWWPYAELRCTEGFHAGDPIRLERGGELPEILQVSDPAFRTSLGQLAPGIVSRNPDPAARWRWGPIVLFSALGAILAGAFLFFWVVPALASFLAPRVPVAWEEGLGNSVLQELAPEERRCGGAAGVTGIETLLGTLTATLPNPAYTFRVFVTDHDAVNAFAAPGGAIVVYRGLLARAETPEALVGVLAHEMQHVVLRHTTRILLEQASTGLLLAAMTGGNAGEGMGFGLEGARVLSLLRYSREHEAEADAGGVRMLLDARVDPSGMIAFFSALEKEEDVEMPGFLSYLSTHPETGDRIAQLRGAGGEARGGFVTLLDDRAWRDVKSICPSAAPAGEGGAEGDA
jgi:Zn-dependent protease with chaperone function